MFSWLATKLQSLEHYLTPSWKVNKMFPSQGTEAWRWDKHLSKVTWLLSRTPSQGCPHTPLCTPKGRSSLSLRQANSPQLFQLFLSNAIYNKLCLNFCLSDNNNNTIIIWSITYSQLYLIKAVISLRVSGNRKLHELYPPTPLVGDCICREQGD